jgi:hypothetical protein
VTQVDRARLQALNPALLPAVWNGKRRVPRGYQLRLPEEAGEWTSARLASALAPAERFAGQPGAKPSSEKPAPPPAQGPPPA